MDRKFKKKTNTSSYSLAKRAVMCKISDGVKGLGKEVDLSSNLNADSV